ncbi:MAG: hypothetical protein COV01_00500 [Candidatus Taylorbacteria bacterium CG10_big_fil_rev_8_21_14_0_10_41_48]|uniref:Uncharacterized protein n=1 Tax=Candidatus Taylorbacteria bacterium CG10_big_fil_rev_8_21_14_0_10_41_48 TaxID=1975024 RepID=A0A2M8LCY4_9BACT|nr:MAG: hypothetical protein COV01_00500 [Candidatus Taylorbacteria bacterium CG10_big_fil_rev_8_21_14_0_10_41_48]
MDPIQTQAENKSIGPVIGIIVIIIVLIVGAFYIWGGKTDTQEAAPLTPTDEVSDIQADLDSSGDINLDLSDIDLNI